MVKQLKYAVDNMTEYDPQKLSLLGNMLETYAIKNGNSCLSILAYDFDIMSKNEMMSWLIPEIRQQLNEMIKNGVPYCDECMWKLEEYPTGRSWI